MGKATTPSILVLCTGNSARSQMAEGILRDLYGDRFDIFSAGTRPTGVRPEAVAVMHEIGVDISRHRSKSADEFAGREIDYVLTVCDNAREECPYFPARTRAIHRAFSDPAAVEGDEPTRLDSFRAVRDEISAYAAGEFAEAIGESRP